MLELVFSIVSTLAALSWVSLIIAGERYRQYVYKILECIVFPALAIVYGVLIVSFFQISGGGFDTFESVKKLLSNDWVLLSGWVHYLIFDLFVGVHVAKRMDTKSTPRLFQAIVLSMIFMFGPIGWFVYYISQTVTQYIHKYLYYFYPADWRMDLQNKVYKYTLVGLTLNLALLPILFIASYVDTRTISDVNIWIKPLKFVWSFGLHFFTLLLVLPLIKKKYLENKFIITTTIIATYSLFLEVIYISVQALRGRESHFNNLTQFENIMYGLMGVGAVIGVFGSFMIGLFVYRYAKENVSFSLKYAAGVGFMLGAVLTFVVAGYLGGNGSHFVDKSFQNTNLLPILGWSTIYGDLRVPHFFALHITQFLLCIALVSTLLVRKFERVIMYCATCALVSLVIFTFWQALNNIPFVSIV